MTVTINKADNPTSVSNNAVVIRDGNSIDLADNVKKNGAKGEVSYAISGESSGCTLNGSVLISGADTGSVTVNVTVAEDDDYKAMEAKSITVIITDKDPQTITAEDVTVIFGETGKSVSANVTEPPTGGGDISYSVKEGAGYIDVDPSTGALTIKKTGIAYVTATAAETRKLKQAAKDIKVTVNKADPDVTAPSPTAVYGQTLADLTLDNPAGNIDGTWSFANPATEVGNVGQNTFPASFEPVDKENYNSLSNVSVTVTVEKADNPANISGTAVVMRGGNTVDLSGNVTLNGAEGTVSYEISGESGGCSLDGSVLTSGEDTGSVTVNVTVTSDANYEAMEAKPITVTITNKDTQTITAEDVTVTYGETDKSVSASVTEPSTGGGEISYAVKDGSGDHIEVDASTGGLTVKSVPADGRAYVTVTAAETQTLEKASVDVMITVNKADPTAAAPSPTAIYGQTLADVILVNPEGNTEGTWAFVNPSADVGTVGDHTFAANFTPADTTDYKSVSNVEVTVTVLKAPSPARVIRDTATVMRGGHSIDLSENIELNGAAGKISGSISGDALGCSMDGSILTTGTPEGTVTVNVTVDTDDNYEAMEATPITVTIRNKDEQIIAADDVTVNYGDTDKRVAASLIRGDGGIVYTVKKNSRDYIDIDAFTGELTVKAVPADGKAYVTVTATETLNYEEAEKDVTVTIGRAKAIPASVKANSRNYDGTEAALVTVTGIVTGGTMQYAIGTAGQAIEAYSETIPTATAPGTYYVWYKAKADSDHEDSDEEMVMVSIIRDQGDVLDEDIPESGIIPDGIWIAGVKDLEYTGKALTQEFRLYDGNRRLLETKDYTVTYKNNTKVYRVSEQTAADPKNPAAEDEKNAPSVIIRMKGNYGEVKPVYFSINAIDISTEEFSVSDMSAAYNGKKQTPAPVLTWKGKKLKAGTDFTVKEYIEKKDDKTAFTGEPGRTTEYPLTVTGIGNFTGSRDIKLTIAGKTEENVPVVLMKDVKAPFIPGQAYTGEEYTLDTLKDRNGGKLAFAVLYKNMELTPGTDYEAVFTDARDAGIATIILRGLNNTDSKTGLSFVGEKRITFKIAGLQISKTKINGLEKSYAYTGEEITPAVTLTADGRPVPADDYTIAYEKNIKVGTATMIITGQNSCQGTKKVSFKIAPYDMSTDRKAIVINNGEPIVTGYVKGGAQPKITVTFNGNKIFEGKDYTVRYSNNNKIAGATYVDAPTVTITGKGSFKGSREVKFTINRREFSEGNGLTLLAPDVTVNSKISSGKIRILDSNGKELKAGTDYEKEIKYFDARTGEPVNKDYKPAESGIKLRVEVKGTGMYTPDLLTGEIRVINKDRNISKATVKIANLEYTGSEVKITGQEQFTKATIKIDGQEKQLTLGRDFEIVEGSYINNVNRGTAKVTIHGLEGGEYGLGGYKTVTFRIGTRPVSEWWKGLFAL